VIAQPSPSGVEQRLRRGNRRLRNARTAYLAAQRSYTAQTSYCCRITLVAVARRAFAPPLLFSSRVPYAPLQLADSLRPFIRMYEPHAAREDTVLFPAFREMLSERELKKLMDVFEDKEKALPHGGFEKMVDEVAKIEQSIGIYDLAKFTPA
jgi:hypothetical protein